MNAQPYILVGAGDRARAWWSFAARSPRFRAVAQVTRHGRSLEGLAVPRFERLDDALAAHPDAVVLAPVPPRFGLEIAQRLAALGRVGLVEAPLAAVPETLGKTGEAGVAVAHGWVTLPGRQWLARVLASFPASDVTVEVRGLPESDGGDLAEVVLHALALLRRLFPGLKPVDAKRVSDGVVEASFLAASGTAVRLRALSRGRQLDVQFRGIGARGGWHWAPDEESVVVRGKAGDDAPVQRRPAPPAEVRALQQLVDPRSGDTLADAREVSRLAEVLWERLGARPPLSSRRLQHARAIAQRRPDDVEAQLGLVRELEPPETVGRVGTLAIDVPAGHLELYPFRAGLKPVCFLTTRPERVAAELARFGDVHVERRERLVLVGPQDQWVDRRDVGEPWVELYVSKDPALARRAAELQALSDPTKGLVELGRLLGYPACCTEAFALQEDRSNNSRNRYVTAARTAGASWPWELNNLVAMLVPFFPCRFDCPAALAWARGALDELRKDHPAIVEGLARDLSAPALYFDHEHQLHFPDARGGGPGRLAYGRVLATSDAPPAFLALARVFAAGDALSIDDSRIEVTLGGRPVARWRRTDPGLGLLAPFGG